jgi:hypothetical protein
MPNIANLAPELGIMRPCSYCYEPLSLKANEAHDKAKVQCPVCRKTLRIRVKGFLNKKLVLEKTSFF